MIDIKDIYWLAGLLEGEGCFAVNNSAYYCPQITLKMTDRDVVEKAHRLLRATSKVNEERRYAERNKPIYWFRVMGSLAASWMMTLYPLMGERRQEKIREVLEVWKLGKYQHRGLGVPAWLDDGRRNPDYDRLYKAARAEDRRLKLEASV